MAIVEVIFGRRWAANPARDEDWDAWYADQLPRVYNFFRFRVGDGPVAEDLVSTTFTKAWTARSRYRSERGAASTWLMAIARRVAIDHWRSRHEHEPLEAAGAVAGGEDPAEIAERRSAAERLARLLAALPERERELVALKYGAELTNRSIASVMGLSESNVGTVLHRVVQRLRADWHKEPENG